MVENAAARERGVASGRGLRAMLAGALAASVFGALGCENDGWLYDPSIVGRWEHTPTVVPILDRIDVIERDEGEFFETTAIEAEDLIPVVRDYQAAPSDVINIEIWDFLNPGAPTPFQRSVDGRGFIDLPQVGRVNVLGLTSDEIRERLREVLRDQDIIRDALVTVQIVGQREQTYSVFGFISGPGRYFIPKPDYRLLEALTEAGGLPTAVKRIYVIRQTPLRDEIERGVGVEPAERPVFEREDTRPADERGRDIDELIQDLTDPDAPSPGMFAARQDEGEDRQVIEEREGGREEEGGAPPIDLIDDPGVEPVGVDPIVDAPTFDYNEDRWMFLNGEWVRVQRRSRSRVGLPEGEDALARKPLTASDLVTQRVIEVPADPLLQGVAEYNIVVRPGDVIRVPAPDQGVVYMGGPGIVRPGVYNLPQNGRLTITKAIISAGGLSGIAVPWRVDLTRMVGDDRQATIRLNLKAIFEGTQPDVFLRSDDVVNVGTAFWAVPLAVIRNGFRFSYGFGFLLDRNFGNDVFGAPPSNVGGTGGN